MSLTLASWIKRKTTADICSDSLKKDSANEKNLPLSSVSFTTAICSLGYKAAERLEGKTTNAGTREQRPSLKTEHPFKFEESCSCNCVVLANKLVAES